MDTKVVNSVPSSEGIIHINESVLKEYGEFTVKNISVKKALDTLGANNPLLSVLDALQSSCEASSSNARVYVRAKYITAGVSVCIPGWHVDGYRDLNCGWGARFAIWSNMEGTEFLTNPFSVIGDQVVDFTDAIDPMEDLPYLKAKDGELISYGFLNYHRGPIPTRSGFRTLMRVTNARR